MPSLVANNLTIEYETHGDEGGEPLLLIMGVGTQLIHWPDGLIDELVARGFRVIRFDNRDSGLSTKLAWLGTPNLKAISVRWALGMRVTGPYAIADMAADAAGLIEGLGLESAHVLGCSMGGMIAQALTLSFPERVRSLTSLMSTPGERRMGSPKASLALLGKIVPTLEGSVARGLKIHHALRGTRFPSDEAAVRALSARAFARSFSPDGFKRQMAAILSSPSRRKALEGIRTPTLVVHGTADPLIPFASGEETARAIPTARLVPVDGLGHELPSGFWPELADLVAGHALKSPATT